VRTLTAFSSITSKDRNTPLYALIKPQRDIYISASIVRTYPEQPLERQRLIPSNEYKATGGITTFKKASINMSRASSPLHNEHSQYQARCMSRSSKSSAIALMLPSSGRELYKPFLLFSQPAFLSLFPPSKVYQSAKIRELCYVALGAAIGLYHDVFCDCTSWFNVQPDWLNIDPVRTHPKNAKTYELQGSCFCMSGFDCMSGLIYICLIC
jgi:hypothetical protein